MATEIVREYRQKARPDPNLLCSVQLPKAEQQFVSHMLETVLGHGAR